MIGFVFSLLGVVIVLAYSFVYLYRFISNGRSRLKRAYLKTLPPNTVILHQVERASNVPTVSPFPLKLETFLRAAEIPYQNEFKYAFSPKGKTPWISYNDEEIYDSSMCMEWLQRRFNVDLSAHLSDEQKAIARTLQKTAEEHTYWAMCYMTFMPKCLKPLQEIWPHKGWLQGVLVLRLVRWQVRRQLYSQGMGRHLPEEIKSIAHADLLAFSRILGDKPYFFGRRFTEVDCAMFGILVQVLWNMHGTAMQSWIKGDDKEFDNLYQFCSRVQSKFWPEWVEIPA